MYARDLAWAAGFFDAEGCFSDTPTMPVATISQVHLDCLDAFAQVVGTGTINGPYEKATATMNRKPQWVFNAYGTHAIAIFEALQPWLGRYRREQGARAFRLDVEVDPEECRAFALHPFTEQIAWAGGFFDGEGCFSICGDGLNARINNTDLGLLEQFRTVVGIGKVYGPYQPHRTSFGKKPQYVFTVSGLERVQALFALLWNDIGSAKRLRAMEILYDHLTYWKCGHKRGDKWKMHCPKCFKPGPKPGFKNARVRNAGTAQLLIPF